MKELRNKEAIEKDLSETKKVIGYAEGLDRYILACRLHDLNNELGWANKLKAGTKSAI